MQPAHLPNIAEDAYRVLLNDAQAYAVPLFPVPPDTCSSPALASKVKGAGLHPDVECALHLLNGDLPSANRALRTVSESDKAACWLSGIMHRMQGDYRTAEQCYAELARADSEDGYPPPPPFVELWGRGAVAQHKATRFLERLSQLADRVRQEGKLEMIVKNRRRSALEENEDLLQQLREQAAKGSAEHRIPQAESARKSDLDWEIRDMQKVAQDELVRIAEWAGQTFE